MDSLLTSISHFLISNSRFLVLVLCTSIVAGFLLAVLYITILYPTIFSPLKDIPTPDRSFLSGTTLSSPSIRSLIGKSRYWVRTVPNDGLIRIYLKGVRERLLVTSPQALGEILVTKASHFAKPAFVRQRLHYVTGNGLLLAEGDEHKEQRRSLMPAFAFRHIKDLYPVFWLKAKELSKGIQEHVVSNQLNGSSNVIEVRKWSRRATLDIIGLAGMEYDFDSLRDPRNPISLQYEKMIQNPSLFEVIIGSCLSAFMPARDASVILRLPTKRVREIREASLYIRQLCQTIIEQKQAKIKASTSHADIDIISVALRSNTFSSENLVDQMMTFLAAGHGTTSIALQWAIYALCKNNDVQKRLRREIRENLPSISGNNCAISADDIDSLPYLHAFCNEVLRFWPPVPSTVREALHDTTVAGYPIPKGTIFTLAPAATNHDTELWGPEADVFNPERWMKEDCVNSGGVKSNYGFLTFIHGPRSCPGDRFAKAELVCMVAALVGRFRVELEDPRKEEAFDGDGIAGVAPSDGVRAKFEVIDGW